MFIGAGLPVSSWYFTVFQEVTILLLHLGFMTFTRKGALCVLPSFAASFLILLKNDRIRQTSYSMASIIRRKRHRRERSVMYYQQALDCQPLLMTAIEGLAIQGTVCFVSIFKIIFRFL